MAPHDRWQREGPSNHVTAIYRHIVQVISDQLVEHPRIAFNGVRARVGGGRGSALLRSVSKERFKGCK